MTERFESVNHESKGEQIYLQLAQALVQGKLLPGERVKIRELAEQMGTSVTPVRDAILRLVQDGVLVMLSARDIRVRCLRLEEYLEIRNIRVELEGMAAAQAAMLATEADIQTIAQIVETNVEAIRKGDIAQAVALNQDFHFALCRIANMPLLSDILYRLWLKVGPLIAQSYEAGGADMIDHHFPVLEAIKRRDANAARVAIQTDLLAGGQAMFDSFTQQISSLDAAV